MLRWQEQGCYWRLMAGHFEPLAELWRDPEKPDPWEVISDAIGLPPTPLPGCLTLGAAKHEAMVIVTNHLSRLAFDVGKKASDDSL